MGRYDGTLHKLVDNACSSNRKTTWNQVMHYLEGHTVSNNSANNPVFDSPLPPYTGPSVELEVELFDQQGPKREDSPLKIAVKAAPAHVVAALCHLGPEAASLADGRDRIPLHWACRRSSEDPETDKVLEILIKCYPAGLLHRDEGGRTALHWLFWYHADSRSPKIVEIFSKNLPLEKFKKLKQPNASSRERFPLPEIPTPNVADEIPANAFIIHDAKHGALPLHYAVMQGANKATLTALINGYPLSKAMGDRKGRTPLAWYLGAGHLIDNKKHICGEMNDPNAKPWWEMKLSASLIQILISSRVARVTDDTGRHPLHWACHLLARSLYSANHACLNVKAIQILEDNHVQALTSKDLNGKTPLQIFFDTVLELQELDYKRHLANRTLRDNVDLINGGLVTGGPTPFRPPKQLVQLLIKSPETDGQEPLFRFDARSDDKTLSAAFVEDPSGGLPLHAALRAATSPDIIQLLIQTNPTSLVHTTEDPLQTPLIHALCSAYATPLQPKESIDLMLAAYVTSRHGTFMDGRLALKMEDAAGKYPIHYACQNQASLEVIKLFLEKFPRSALFQNSDGDLPVHCLLSQQYLFEPPQSGIILGATLAQPMGFLTDKELSWHKKVKEVYRQKMAVLMNYLVSVEHLQIASSAHGMTPLHIAVAFDAVPYNKLFQMLERYPQAVRLLTTVKGYEFSCLDLHELHKNESEDDIEQWSAVRELLYAFHPTIATHRGKEELLEACVKLIRNEVTGKGSYHLEQMKHTSSKLPPAIDLSETLSAIEVPEIDCAFRPQKFGQASTPRRNPKAKPPKDRSIKKAPTAEKSIYDDDMGGRYIVSPQNSDEDDDSDDFISSEEEEEYCSDESSDSEEDSIEGTSLEASTRSSWDTTKPSKDSSWDKTDERSSWDPYPRSFESSPTKSFGRQPKNGRNKISMKHIEEKKEEEAYTPRNSDAHFIGDVAMRLWCFFLLYNNPKDPEDNYVKYVEAVLDDLPFEMVEHLINLSVPSYAQEYLEQGTNTLGVTLRDVASPRPKALIHRYYYFVGSYEFSMEKDGMLLHRNSDSSTVTIRATQHLVSTEAYKAPTEHAPGAVEEAIWSSGEMVPDEKGYMASKFGHASKQVYFKFTRNQEAFNSEVQCRVDMGVAEGASGRVVPLVEHFRAGGDSKGDRRYTMDVNDERFQTLNLFGGESIKLADYPYALVFPYCDEGDLFDYFYHHRLEGIDEISDIGAQIGKALQMIHTQGVVHGNVSMRNIAMLPLEVDDEEPRRSWALTDLSNASRLQSGTSYLGSVFHNGSAPFASGLLPPEMFVKLTGSEVKMYQAYWAEVEKAFNIKVDQRVVKPCVNLETGNTYVLRCHYVPSEGQTSSLPPLPYKLVPARESSDIWCFGQLVFTLCSGGRPLFPTNVKTGHLLDYESIARWDKKTASSMIYEHVEDTLAQDIILHLLSPYEDHVDLTLEAVLDHPFFTRASGDSDLVAKVVEQRRNECASRDRWKKQILKERSEDDWLKQRTVNVNCWSFDTLMRIHFSPSEIVRKMVGHKTEALAMPCSFIILPYKLSANNKKGKLAPTTKKDVERAERMGIIILALSKACHFALYLKEIIQKEGKVHWTSTKLVNALSFSSDDFKPLISDLMKMAAEHVEVFRHNPMVVAYKLVARRIMDFKACFNDSKKAFLYLVDEFDGIPLAGSKYAPYPIEVPEEAIDQILTKGLPFMHATSLYMRGTAGGVAGLVRLIFEAAYPHVPPSWALASKGLGHNLDEGIIMKEVLVLQETLASMSSSKVGNAAEDLQYIRDVFLRFDVRRSFGDMKKVECAGSSLWTTTEGAEEIVEAAQAYGFKEALEIQSTLETQLKRQNEEIKRLREEMERLTFRKALNLEVPDEAPSSVQPADEIDEEPESNSDNSVEVADEAKETEAGVADTVKELSHPESKLETTEVSTKVVTETSEIAVPAAAKESEPNDNVVSTDESASDAALTFEPAAANESEPNDNVVSTDESASDAALTFEESAQAVSEATEETTADDLELNDDGVPADEPASDAALTPTEPSTHAVSEAAVVAPSSSQPADENVVDEKPESNSDNIVEVADEAKETEAGVADIVKEPSHPESKLETTEVSTTTVATATSESTEPAAANESEPNDIDESTDEPASDAARTFEESAPAVYEYTEETTSNDLEPKDDGVPADEPASDAALTFEESAPAVPKATEETTANYSELNDDGVPADEPASDAAVTPTESSTQAVSEIAVVVPISTQPADENVVDEEPESNSDNIVEVADEAKETEAGVADIVKEPSHPESKLETTEVSTTTVATATSESTEPAAANESEPNDIDVSTDEPASDAALTFEESAPALSEVTEETAANDLEPNNDGVPADEPASDAALTPTESSTHAVSEVAVVAPSSSQPADENVVDEEPESNSNNSVEAADEAKETEAGAADIVKEPSHPESKLETTEVSTKVVTETSEITVPAAANESEPNDNVVSTDESATDAASTFGESAPAMSEATEETTANDSELNDDGVPADEPASDAALTPTESSTHAVSEAAVVAPSSSQPADENVVDEEPESNSDNSVEVADEANATEAGAADIVKEPSHPESKLETTEVTTTTVATETSESTEPAAANESEPNDIGVSTDEPASDAARTFEESAPAVPETTENMTSNDLEPNDDGVPADEPASDASLTPTESSTQAVSEVAVVATANESEHNALDVPVDDAALTSGKSAQAVPEVTEDETANESETVDILLEADEPEPDVSFVDSEEEESTSALSETAEISQNQLVIVVPDTADPELDNILDVEEPTQVSPETSSSDVYYNATEPDMDGLNEADTDSACDQTTVSKQDTVITVSASQSAEETQESIKDDEQVEE
jgi:serine/threonine protein kinase/ankyrin repeat protein